MGKQKKLNLTDKQIELVEKYHANDMYELKKICNPLIHRKGVSGMYRDDLYAVASDTLLESLESYDDSKECSFKTFLTGNINRAFYDWTRDNRRGKRCNVERDSNGRIRRDKKGNPIIISDISLDAPTDEGLDIVERIDSGFQIEDELPEEIGFSCDDKVGKYLSRLSTRQRKIVLLLSDGYSQDEIREIVHISKKEYADSMMSIRAYENIRVLM